MLFNINKRKQPRINYRVWTAAASIVLLISSGVFYLMNANSHIDKIQTIAQITKETAWGQKMNVTLSDSTIVKLNAGSKLEFPEKFSDSLREVKLTGEAFFDVAHNPKKPFIIKTGALTTKVLGTSFNVEAYKDSENIKVTLATGKIALSNKSSSITLIPAEQAVFGKINKDIEVNKVDISKYLAWKDGILRFENSSLMEAASKLEKWYGVQVEFENEVH